MRACFLPPLADWLSFSSIMSKLVLETEELECVFVEEETADEAVGSSTERCSLEIERMLWDTKSENAFGQDIVIFVSSYNHILVHQLIIVAFQFPTVDGIELQNRSSSGATYRTPPRSTATRGSCRSTLTSSRRSVPSRRRTLRRSTRETTSFPSNKTRPCPSCIYMCSFRWINTSICASTV